MKKITLKNNKKKTNTFLGFQFLADFSLVL